MYERSKENSVVSRGEKQKANVNWTKKEKEVVVQSDLSATASFSTYSNIDYLQLLFKVGAQKLLINK